MFRTKKNEGSHNRPGTNSSSMDCFDSCSNKTRLRAHVSKHCVPSSATKWRIVNRICVQLAIQEVSFRFFSQTLFWANPWVSARSTVTRKWVRANKCEICGLFLFFPRRRRRQVSWEFNLMIIFTTWEESLSDCFCCCCFIEWLGCARAVVF